MRPSSLLTVVTVALAALVLGATVTSAADREYRVLGTVVDTDQQPIADASLEMRERESRRRFKDKTDKEGSYIIVGIPHGVYEVTVSKDGYVGRTVEWDLRERQEQMRKVEYAPFVLESEAHVRERERGAELLGMVGEANELVRRGDIDGAQEVLTKVLSDAPDDANALYLKGFCHLQKDDVEAAEATLTRVIELVPEMAAAQVYLGICHERRDDPEGALALYEAALVLDPDNLLALYNAGVLHYNADRVGQAKDYFQRAVEVNPDDDSALEMLAYCHLQAEEYAEALRLFERARVATSDEQRATTLDEVINSLREQVQKPEDGGSDG